MVCVSSLLGSNGQFKCLSITVLNPTKLQLKKKKNLRHEYIKKLSIVQEINAVMRTTCLDLFCATLGSSAGTLFNNRCFVTLNNYTKPELPPNPLYLQPHTRYCPHNQKTKQEFCVANNSLKPKRALFATHQSSLSPPSNTSPNISSKQPGFTQTLIC